MRRDRSTSRWGRRVRLVFGAVVAICLLSALAASADVDLPGGGVPTATGAPGPALTMGRTVPAWLSVASTGAGQPVPPGFLGLSTEYWSLPEWAAQERLLERTMSLIHAAGTGPMTLRVGGDSADHSFWDPSAARLPRWAFALAPPWLSRLRSLIGVLGVRVILDLNLITDLPGQASAWARAARTGLPRGSIAAFEIGNEPDIYNRSDWLAMLAGRGVLAHPLPHSLTIGGYVRAFRADAALVHAIAPGTPLAGPALARPQVHAGWIAPLERSARRWLGMITVHRYPYSACARAGTRAFPTLARLLSPAASSGLAQSLRPAVEAAHDADLPLRLTELNSVTCGGRPGVSDTFATALWAPSTMFSLVRAGVSSADIHVRANTINAPFALTRHGLLARPELYGLILFSRALGPHARLIHTVVSARSRLNLHAWAVRVGRAGPGTLHVVVVDSGPRSVRLSMRLPAQGPAYVQRLLAPTVASTGGVTFAGQRLDPQAAWTGRLRIGRIGPRQGAYTVEVRRRSAALISVAAAPNAATAVASGDRRSRAGGRAPRVAPSPRR